VVEKMRSSFLLCCRKAAGANSFANSNKAPLFQPEQWQLSLTVF
jgi:hypothetical protein